MGARRRRSKVVHLLAAIVTATAVLGGAGRAVGGLPCWSPPVAGVVVDEFRPPACPWCPGNRGLEYGTRPGTEVRAVETGVVTFSGVVAGTRYVVVAGPGERLVTYGRLASTALRSGDAVARGTLVGSADRAVYFGVRLSGVYVDPAPMLGELVGRRRLVPTDGTRPRPAPPTTLRCA